MAKETERIAVASSDGIVVNNHFGHAAKFHIYEVCGDEIKYLEVRKVEPVCDGGTHDEKRLNENIEKIGDCRYLLVSRIGEGAAAAVEQKGITPYELPGIIGESIQQLLNYIKIKKLFE